MSMYKLLDLFCGGGGAGVGYWLAGFEVVGVDINPQPNYPFDFIQADAIDFLRHNHKDFDYFHASPPCQAFTEARKCVKDKTYPNLIPATRDLLALSGKPYVIENVPGAPLLDPIELCGTMFGLRTYRHRLFETNFPVIAPHHPKHKSRQAKMGRLPKSEEFIQVVGHFAGVEIAKEAMGIGWMVRDELAQAIPPAYTEYLGRQLLAQMEKAA